MIVATIAIAALLGSASVAQAGRKCIKCGIDLRDIGGDFDDAIVEMKRKQEACGTKDLSKYLALPAKEQIYYGISITDCGDDPCFFLRREGSGGEISGVRVKGDRGCFTPEYRDGFLKLGMKALPNGRAICKKFGQKTGLKFELCLEVCDTDRCNN